LDWYRRFLCAEPAFGRDSLIWPRCDGLIWPHFGDAPGWL
jgi:hypothetical protein